MQLHAIPFPMEFIWMQFRLFFRLENQSFIENHFDPGGDQYWVNHKKKPGGSVKETSREGTFNQIAALQSQGQITTLQLSQVR